MLISTFLSLTLHAVVVLAFAVGIPFFEQDLKNTEPLVFVTIVDDVPETNQPSPSAKAESESKEIEIASKTPPAPSQPSAMPSEPSSILPDLKSPTEQDKEAKKQPLIKKSETLEIPVSTERPSILLPETSSQIDSQKLPISKPKSRLKKVEIASPKKRPDIPKPQKKPLSRPEVKPEKKELAKSMVVKSDTPKVKQEPKPTTRDLLKTIIKPIQKPKKENNLLAKETPTKTKDDAMSGVLQNLAQASAATGQKSRSKSLEKAETKLDAEEINSNLQSSLQIKPNRSLRFGASDIYRLQSHIAKCWSPPAGAQNAEKLVVSVRVRADKDGTVTSVQSMDLARFQIDRFYRTAARAAERAVEECSPLPLPSEKYETWKDFIFDFDPSFLGG